MILEDPHYRAIGRISVEFSNAELWVNAFVWQLIGPDQLVGQIVTSKMSFKSTLDLFAALFRHRFKDVALQEKCNELIARLADSEEERNTVLHSTWIQQSANLAEPTRFKITAPRKKGLTHTKETVTAAQLEAIADDCKAAVLALSDMMIPLAATLNQ